MGLRSIPMDQWLLADDHRSEELAEKAALYERDLAAVCAAEPESAEACMALDRLVPEMAGTSAEALTAPAEHVSDALACISRIGLRAQEDFCLHQPGPTGYRLTAATLCSPTHWSLQEKFGKSLDTIHATVPMYAETVARRVNAAIRVLKPLRPMERTNWSILDDEKRFQPSAHHDLEPARSSEDHRISALTLRVERQVLLRLPEVDAVVFSIRVLQCPLSALSSRPVLATQLATVVEQMPAASLSYKGLRRVSEHLIPWLRTAGGD